MFAFQIPLLVLVTAVVFVNGWTDAPNAIACTVSTGALPYRKAVRLAALANLLGILVMGLINASVAVTITEMAGLDLSRPVASAAALCAAMTAIVVFAVVAWYFGIPTSESHALMAALTGSAIALGTVELVSIGAWYKAIAGLGMSLAIGFGLGWLITRLLGPIFSRGKEKAADRIQILSAAGMAFMHGAQDGQKFIAVYLLAGALSRGVAPDPATSGSLWIMLAVAGVMGLGTMVGGKRIITRVGNKMVPLRKYQGACADIGGALCLLIASLWGVPMSTTHTKTSAILGAGLAAEGARVDWGSVRGMLAAWAVTFPVCGLLGYLITRLLVIGLHL